MSTDNYEKLRERMIEQLERYCEPVRDCKYCPINNVLDHCIACDWEDMTDQQLTTAMQAAGLSIETDEEGRREGMTREEKIQVLADFCTNSTSCSDCLVRIPSSPDGSGCKQWREWTDEEIDAALAKLPDAAVQAADTADMVNKPNHYQLPGGLECWDILVACFGAEETKIWAKINAFTHLFRHKRKNGEEDIRKALVNLQKYFELGGEAE